MGKYFGTDGVRAVAGQPPLVQEFVEKLGQAAALWAGAHLAPGVKPVVIMAEDSRESGPLLMQWLVNGFKKGGLEAVSIGIAPTPAVSYLLREENAVLGAVISASHNPAEFNGIKFFDHTGRKLTEEKESEIENILDSLPAENYETAEIKTDKNLLEKYVDFVVSTVPANIFKDKKIALDCANGAEYKTAPSVFAKLGARTVLMAVEPNGKNINDGVGALHTAKMQELVVKENAYGGLSFDGDGDRVIAADEKGRALDGDNIISASALILAKQNKLKSNNVVMTVMANLACINFLKSSGINAALTGVGDKYVSEEMEKLDAVLGGETSGHIIFRSFLPTGDGLLSAVQFLALAVEEEKPLSFFKDMWTAYPALLTAVKVTEKVPLDKLSGFTQLLKQFEKEFCGKGRIFARYSGTEPKMRLLVEGEDEEKVSLYSRELEEKFKEEITALCGKI